MMEYDLKIKEGKPNPDGEEFAHISSQVIPIYFSPLNATNRKYSYQDVLLYNI